MKKVAANFLYVANKICHFYHPSLNKQLGYSGSSKLVIVNIDDVGFHKDETEASFDAFRYGLVKTGSIMAPAPNFDHVINLWKQNPATDLGIHITLTCEWGQKYPWTPILSESEVPSLYNPEGIMWPTDDAFVRHAKCDDIEREMEAQIQKILDTGLKPSHIDHHMSIFLHKDYIPILVRISGKYKIPMHLPLRKKYQLLFTPNNLYSLRNQVYIIPDTQIGIYSPMQNKITLDTWKEKYYFCLRSLKPGVHLIKVHIAFKTKELQNIAGKIDSTMRQLDYDVWTSDETKQIAKERDIIFIGYRLLQQLQEKLTKKL